MGQLPDRDRDGVRGESEDDVHTSFGAWTLVWTLVAMKIITILVVVLAGRKAEAGTLVAVITWHWLVLLGALVAAPVLFRYRLRRVRSRRETLIRAEWMVGDERTMAASAVSGHDSGVR